MRSRSRSRRSSRRSRTSAQGRIVLVVDDADRENEGDFVMAAEKATPEAINFMATHGRGIDLPPGPGGASTSSASR